MVSAHGRGFVELDEDVVVVVVVVEDDINICITKERVILPLASLTKRPLPSNRGC